MLLSLLISNSQDEQQLADFCEDRPCLAGCRINTNNWGHYFFVSIEIWDVEYDHIKQYTQHGAGVFLR